MRILGAPRRWIYVTGAPRSGTTFVGQLLSASVRVDYIHEPFNPDCGLPGIERPFLYLRAGGRADPDLAARIERLFNYDFRLRTGLYSADSRAKRAVKKVVGSRGPFYLRLAKLNPFHTAAVIKDPIGCLLTEYLAEEHGVRPVILIRHPLSFVASLKRLRWPIDLSPLKSQPELLRDHFREDPWFPGDGEASSYVASAATLWRSLNKVILAQARRHPEWTVLTHEALCREPLRRFRSLYRELELPWSSRVERRVRRRTSPSNPAEARGGRTQDFRRDSRRLFELRARMLSEDEKRRVLEITRDVALKWYDENSFGLPETRDARERATPALAHG